MLCCDSCPCSYHAYCLTPPLEELPPTDEQWSCPRCLCDEPQCKPHKIISWRWKVVKYPDPVEPSDIPKDDEKEEDMDEERHTRKNLII